MSEDNRKERIDAFCLREDLTGTDALVRSWLANGSKLISETEQAIKDNDEQRQTIEAERQRLLQKHREITNQTAILAELASKAQEAFEAALVTPGELD